MSALNVAAAAQHIAESAHHGQTDKAGVPYITHPARVAARFHDPLHQAVAWLHDVLEDTPVTADDLRDAGIPDDVLDAVEALTHQPEEPRADYYERIRRAGPMAVAVKLADIDDNSDPDRLARLDGATRDRLTAKYTKARQALI